MKKLSSLLWGFLLSLTALFMSEVVLADDDACEVPVGAEEILDALITGFSVPSGAPAPTGFVAAARGESVRGFVNSELRFTVSEHCTSDHVFVFVWLGGSGVDDADAIADQGALRDRLEIDVFIDGVEVEHFEIAPRLGFSPIAKIAHYFEIIKEKQPSLEIPFEKIVKVGAAYHELGSYERSYLIFRATHQSANSGDGPGCWIM